MSEVITPPGTTEPIFGLNIFFNEGVVFVDQLADGTVTVNQPTPPDGLSPDVTIIAEDPLDDTYDYFIVTDGNDTVVTAAGDDEIYTNLASDFVNAGLGDDVVFGGDGNDRLFGSGGDDGLFGGTGDDIVRGNSGNDVIDGGAGNDNLGGAAGNDRITGGAGNDRFFGGAGNDLLIAGPGKDILVGGLGKDRFQFRGALDAVDKIVDFNPTEDVIELSRALLPASNLQRGRLSASDFDTVDSIGAGSTAKIVYESSTGLIYYNPGVPGSSPVALLEVSKDLSIAADAFRIIG